MVRNEDHLLCRKQGHFCSSLADPAIIFILDDFHDKDFFVKSSLQRISFQYLQRSAFFNSTKSSISSIIINSSMLVLRSLHSTAQLLWLWLKTAWSPRASLRLDGAKLSPGATSIERSRLAQCCCFANHVLLARCCVVIQFKFSTSFNAGISFVHLLTMWCCTLNRTHIFAVDYEEKEKSHR